MRHPNAVEMLNHCMTYTLQITSVCCVVDGGHLNGGGEGQEGFLCPVCMAGFPGKQIEIQSWNLYFFSYIFPPKYR